MKDTYESKRDSILHLNDSSIKIVEINSSGSSANIGLAVGLGVGLGVPAVGGIGFGAYYGVKRKKEKK